MDSIMQELRFDKKIEDIQEILVKKEFEELLDFFDYMVNDDPFIYESAIHVVVELLYSDDERFVKILCNLIEKIASDGAFNRVIDPILEIASTNKSITLSIIDKMNEIGLNFGLCTGIMTSSILGHKIVDKDTIEYLRSDNPNLQRHSLIAIHKYIVSVNSEISKIFIKSLIETAHKIHQSNTNILIQCLLVAYDNYKELITPVLEKEIENRGYAAASIYIQMIRLNESFPISLTKKSIKIIESETPESDLIDLGLAQIYKTDKSFVIEQIRERLQGVGRPIIASWRLNYQIKQVDSKPLIEMLEEEIDKENPKMIHNADRIFEDFFESNEEYLEWCKKWKDDERKKIIIIKTLGNILTKFMYSYEESIVRDDAISLVKEFATKKGLDYDSETKKINFGKDSNEGAENKEATIKALHILKELRDPPVKIDIDIVKRNLNKYPNMAKAVGESWLLKSAKSESPHILAYIYSVEPDLDEMEDLSEKYESENDEMKKIAIGMLYSSIASSKNSQTYWEQVFKTLNDHNLEIPKKKLRDIDNAESILSEAEVLSRLAPQFKIIIEPDIAELRPKKLDVLIEFNGEQALIEIASVSERTELNVAQGVISLPGGKVKNVLLTKLKKQLKNGEVDPKIPVIIILNLKHGLNEYDAHNSIYGELKIQIKQLKDSHQVIEDGVIRDENSFYNENNSDIVTTIAAYKRNPELKDPLVGKFYHPLQLPKNNLSKDFYLRLRTALFGNSEDSDWKSLLKVRGIDNYIAKQLHDNGIEDLGIFANAKVEDLDIKSLDQENLLQLQKESRRVIMALKTDSIRFVHGIDKETYNILTENRINLISEIIKLDEIPKGVDTHRWNIIIEDSKRILN